MTSGGETWITLALCLVSLVSKSIHFLKKKKKSQIQTNRKTKENTRPNEKHLSVDSIF